jgi:tRNA(Ile)-lysidine synthase
VLAARWRKARKRGPKLLAVTIDHGLRDGSAAEARAVKRLAAQFGVDHRTLRWRGDKPATAIQEVARGARYQLLATAAKKVGARHILTAHTLDDQAETVLIRMARGSGLTGLGAMARERMIELPPPARSKAQGPLLLVRPFLDLPKTRLLATLAAARVPFADDPSNRDPRFTRVRMRTLLASLAGEGLDARRLAQLARRLQRADTTIELAVDVAAAAVSIAPWEDRDPIQFDAGKFARLPAEAALRLLGRAVAFAGDEGPVQLAPLEALFAALVEAAAATNRLRRTLAGALVTLAEDRLTVERAPPRSHRSRGTP